MAKWAPIEQPVRAGSVPPNLADYDQACASFSWDAARVGPERPARRTGVEHRLRGGRSPRHRPRADGVALRLLGRDGAASEVTYAELKDLTDRFAAGLAALGVERGDRVFVLAHRTLELYVAALGTLKRGSVFCPLFAAFGAEPIRQRLGRGDGRVLVTTHSLYRRKVAPIREQLPQLEHVLLFDGDRPRPDCPPVPMGTRCRWTRPRTSCSPPTDPGSRSRRPPPTTWRCCTSPAARRACPRGRSTCTMPSWPIT